MSTYTPDRWVILRINTPEYGIVDKILCSWAGSYLYGSSWKLSSGILTLEESEGKDLWVSKQDSGSIYLLRKTSEEMSGIMSNIYQTLLEQVKEAKGGAEIIKAKDYKGVKND